MTIARARRFPGDVARPLAITTKQFEVLAGLVEGKGLLRQTDFITEPVGVTRLATLDDCSFYARPPYARTVTELILGTGEHLPIDPVTFRSLVCRELIAPLGGPWDEDNHPNPRRWLATDLGRACFYKKVRLLEPPHGKVTIQ